MSKAHASSDFLPAARTRIVSFIREFVAGSPNGVVVGISGGVDSALVAFLSVEALGKDKVLGVLMPSSSTPKQDIDDALEVCRVLGIEHDTHPIDPVFTAFTTLLKEKKDKVTEGNLKARIRMCILYWYANSMNKLVIGTDDKSEHILGFYCYDETTRVVTNGGPKGIDELRKDDVVFALDPVSRHLVEARVGDVFKFDYNGDMVQFKSRSVDLTVTPNHRMLIHPSSSNLAGMTFRTAEECLKRKGTITPTPVGWKGGKSFKTEAHLFTFTQRHVKRTVEIKTEDLLYVFGLFIGDGSTYKGSITAPVVPGLSRQEYTKIGRSVAGRFLKLEDSTGPTMKTYPTYETSFALPYYTKDKARQNLQRLLTKYQIRFLVTPDTVRIGSKEIYELFAQCGIGALSKHIPRWLLNYPSEYLVHLLRGLKDSDGSHPDNVDLYWTSSESLKDDFVEVCVKLGRLPTVRLRPAKVVVMKNHGGKKIHSSASYSISYGHQRRGYRFIRSSNASLVPYAGRVWCPSVPPFENILVERNGKYIFSGNTKYGDGGVDFNPIGDLYKTEVREMSKLLGVPKSIVSKPSSPRLWEGHEAETELGITYAELDKQIVSGKVKDEKIRLMIKKNAHKAGDPPIPSLQDLRASAKSP
jgi:NH3-dependent NAD+ synthetase